MDNARPFGHWLRQRRKALDITQEQLSERIGCAPTTIRMIEKGQRRPSRQVAQLLAQCLQIPEQERDEFLRSARANLPTTLSEPYPDADENPDARLAASSHSAIPYNLPVQLTSLLGRNEEIETLVSLLLRRASCLVTLTGGPGVGKTSLAIAVARAAREHQKAPGESNPQFNDGIFWVPLASLIDPRMVLPAIEQVLGLSSATSEPVLDTLKRYLKQRHLLLVLDNFEHVIDATSSIAGLVAACPGLKILVTSREALNVSSELTFNVPPLPLPTRGETAVQTLASNPAVALFVERARSSDHTFHLSERNAEAVSTLCARVEGVPLAIELIATRIKMMPPAALLREFRIGGENAASTLRLLSGGARDLPARHRTLRAAIGWSYNLLATNERILFDRLGVFRGGFTLDAVEAVCNAAGELTTINRIAIIDGLESLIDKSLVKRENWVDREEEPRYTMLETIREFAAEHFVESHDLPTIKQWHLEYYLALARASRLQILGTDQQKWMQKLDVESDNIRAALRWAIDWGTLEAAAQLGLALVAYWYVRGKSSEGHRWLEEIVGHEKRESLSLIVRAEILGWAGYLAGAYSDLDQAVHHLNESLELLRQSGDRTLLGDILSKLGVMETFRGNYERAANLLTETITIYREAGLPRDIGVALHGLALLDLFTGDHMDAELLEIEAVQLLRGAGDNWHAGLSLSILGLALCRSGQLDRAELTCEQAFALLDGLEGSNLPRGIVLTCRAEIAIARDDSRLAKTLFCSALAELRDTGNFPSIAFALLGLGEVAVEEGAAERAATLFGAMNEVGTKLAMVPVVPSVESRYAACMEGVKASLSEAEWEQAWITGQNFSLDDTIAFALRLDAIESSLDSS